MYFFIFKMSSMVSILMPIYNGIEFIDESVSSILNQSYQDWELIIGINGHTPCSEIYNIAKNYECDKIKVYDLDTKGKPDSLNKMLGYCGGKYISLLDVDDKWLPSKLEKQIPYINNYDIIGSMCQYFGERSDSPDIPTGDLKDFNFLSVNPVINSSCLVRKELCHWIDKFFGVEDYEMWLRLWKENRRFFNLSEVLVFHRIHSTSSFNAKGNHNHVDDLRKSYLL
jgi:teichuronic acid biosynthesis glycosyltransferase TuaG